MTKHLLDKTQYDERLLNLIREMLEASRSYDKNSKYRHSLNNYGSGPTFADIADCLNQMDMLTPSGIEWDGNNLNKYESRISPRTKKMVNEGVDYEALEKFENPFAAQHDRSQKEADKDLEQTWDKMMGKEEWRTAYVTHDAMYADSEYEKVMSELKDKRKKVIAMKKSCLFEK
jgi:hypothetical protein